MSKLTTPVGGEPALKSFIMVWCIYDPDSYMGHRIKRIEAPTMEDAERVGKEFLNQRMINANWEYNIFEVAAERGYCLYDTRKKEVRS